MSSQNDGSSEKSEKTSALSVAAKKVAGAGRASSETILALNVKEQIPESAILGAYAVVEGSWSGAHASEACEWAVSRLKKHVLERAANPEGAPLEIFAGQTLKWINQELFSLNASRADGEKFFVSMSVCIVTKGTLYFSHVGRCLTYLYEGDRLKRMFPEFGRKMLSEPCSPDRPKEAELGERPDCDILTLSFSAGHPDRSGVFFAGRRLGGLVDTVTLTQIIREGRSAEEIVGRILESGQARNAEAELCCVMIRLDESQWRERSRIADLFQTQKNRRKKLAIVAAFIVIIAGMVAFRYELISWIAKDVRIAEIDGDNGDLQAVVPSAAMAEAQVNAAPVQTALQLETDPSGAEIYLNGKSSGLFTPSTLNGQAGMLARIEFLLEGYEADAIEMRFPTSGETRVERTLTPLAMRWVVEVKCNPYCDQLSLDGETVRTRRTAAINFRLAEGDHRIKGAAQELMIEELIRVGPDPSSRKVEFRFPITEEKTSAEAAPEPETLLRGSRQAGGSASPSTAGVASARKRAGLLSVRANVADASIMIFRGSELAYACMGLCRVQLSAGDYTVEASKEGYRSKRESVVIESDRQDLSLFLTPE